MNFVIVTALLGKDAKVVNSRSGKKFLSLRAGIEDRGEKTPWADITCFSPEIIKESEKLKKGTRIMVTGKLKTNGDGKLFISADEIAVIPKRKKKSKAENKKKSDKENGSYDPFEEEPPF